jgi:DNA-binding transcriptional ArsR family regulator
MKDQHVIGSFEEMRAISDPLRSRILAVLGRGAMTTLQVARELGEKPTRLYHHVDILERAGLIRLVREQPKRGTVERYLEPVARVFVIDRDLFTPGGAAPRPDAAHALADGVLGQTLAELRRIADEGVPFDRTRMKLARLHVRGGEARISRLMRDIEALIDQAVDAADGPQAEDEPLHEYRFQLAFFPLPAPRAGKDPSTDPHATGA